jgi:hypothetical protein
MCASKVAIDCGLRRRLISEQLEATPTSPRTMQAPPMPPDTQGRARPRSQITTGVQSGVQTERNCEQLRTTQTHDAEPKHAQINRNPPAGGRAVAGSNPVSPITKLLQAAISAEPV